MNVETALAEVLDAYEGDHFRGNEASPGQHKAIRQPNLGGTKALLWDSRGNGEIGARLRVYADSENIWFTLNASWNGSAWARDNTRYYAGGFCFSRLDFEFLHEDTFAATFTTWTRRWLLPMSNTVNSAFELAGTVIEVGRLGLEGTNSFNGTRTVAGGGVTFCNRFPAAPSSITLSVNTASGGFAGTPNTGYADRDGFGYKANRKIGGSAPSKYLAQLQSEPQVKLTNAEMDDILKSHVIDPALLRGDSYREFYAARKAALLAIVERAMGKASAVAVDVVADDEDDDEDGGEAA